MRFLRRLYEPSDGNQVDGFLPASHTGASQLAGKKSRASENPSQEENGAKHSPLLLRTGEPEGPNRGSNNAHYLSARNVSFKEF